MTAKCCFCHILILNIDDYFLKLILMEKKVNNVKGLRLYVAAQINIIVITSDMFTCEPA